jgi:hypothetical protein
LSNNGVLHNPINDKRTTEGVFHGEFGKLVRNLCPLSRS